MCYLTPVTLNKQKQKIEKTAKNEQKNPPRGWSVTCSHSHAPSLVLVELLTDISPICVEEFELRLKPRGIIWCAQLAYVLSGGVHSAHHHLLDGNGFCQVLDTESNMQTRGDWWPERARERQNVITITFQRNTKQAAQRCSYRPVRLRCPHKCMNTESLDRHTQLNIKTLQHKSVSDTWWMVRTLLSAFHLRTNRTSSPSSTEAADEPLSESELSFLRFSPIFLFIYFLPKTEATFRMEGQIPCHSNEMWHGQSCWHDLAYMPSNCVTAIHVCLCDVKRHTVIGWMKRYHRWELNMLNCRIKN